MNKEKPIVVVVDDSSTVRVFFERVVADLDVELITFGSAEDAMAYLRHNRPDLLILDIIMPTKDGLTFLQELRRVPLHAETSTVVISSKDYAQDKQTAKELGVLEFVAKPMSTKTVQDLILKYAESD
jgi:chemosensory pili system protein ChpA (sensor histidine kinase/response regulator)